YPRGYEGPRRRILLADDNPDNLDVLGKFFRQLGFDVDEAPDGGEAVRVALANRPDIVFMDLVMPTVDGFSATAEFPRLPALATVPIVAVPASAFDATRTQSVNAGCQAFLSKPIKLDEVAALVERLLDIRWIYRSDFEAAEVISRRAESPDLDPLPRGVL